MRVGLLTFRWVYNYGALLQAYALRRVMASMGARVEFINYVLPEHESPLVRGIGVRDGSFIWRAPLRLRFEAFRRLHLPATKRVCDAAELERLSTAYDAIVVGSDQVWSGKVHNGFYPAYFLDFVKEDRIRRISYAACFGQKDQPAETLQGAGRLLKRFDHLSVRNKMSQDLVKQLSGRSSLITQDPTIIHDFAEFSRREASPGQYILVYSLAADRQGLGEAVVARVREQFRMPVVTVWPGLGFTGADRLARSVGPLQWLRLFQNAGFICTDSFHGTAFAVKFRKPFVAWAGARPERLRDLLAGLGLHERLVTDAAGAALSFLTTPIDYPGVIKRLLPQIEESRIFLANALSAG